MHDKVVFDWDCRGHARLQAMRLRSMRVDAVVSVKEPLAGPALAHTGQSGLGIKREFHQVCYPLAITLMVDSLASLELARTFAKFNSSL